jgi:hypothetical protein
MPPMQQGGSGLHAYRTTQEAGYAEFPLPLYG